MFRLLFNGYLFVDSQERSIEENAEGEAKKVIILKLILGAIVNYLHTKKSLESLQHLLSRVSFIAVPQIVKENHCALKMPITFKSSK